MTEQTVVDEIASALEESNTKLLAAVADTIGEERCRDFLRQVQEIEANGGMMVASGKRRRTPGGIFFKLIKENVSKKERKAIWPSAPKTNQGNAQASAPIKMTWDEAKRLVAQIIKTPGEAQTVKVTLVGRPLKVIQQSSCVVVSMKGKEPPSLPKGLPEIPSGSAITWAVFIANKQWNRVKEAIETDEKDRLIIEGYPLVGKQGVAAVMAMNCRSVAMERAKSQ